MNDKNRADAGIKKSGSRIFLLSLIIITVVALVVVMLWSGKTQSANVGEDKAKPHPGSQQALPEITVYKSPTCGCCSSWVTHLEKEGFKVTSHDKENMDSIKKSFGVQSHFVSCHTATIGGYVIEGHVPAADIKRLLREKPEAAGLSAPGMPQHSPGMQPPGEKPADYNVLMFDKEGKTKVYTKY